MADVSEVLDRFRDYARDVFDDAVDGMGKRLLEIVPVGEPDPLGRSRGGPRLIDTYNKQATFEAQGSFAATIGFDAPQATFSNDLMPRHWITPRRPGYPLRFMGSDGTVVRTMKVDHPGNINSRSLGWWDKTVTNGNWSYEVELAVRGVRY